MSQNPCVMRKCHLPLLLEVEVAQRSFILNVTCILHFVDVWSGLEELDAVVYFCAFLTAAYHEDEHVKLVFESCLFFSSVITWRDWPGIPGKMVLFWTFVFFWKGLVNYLILEAETALSVLYIRRLNASRAFYIQLMHKATSEPMYLVYYSPFVIMLNSQTGHVWHSCDESKDALPSSVWAERDACLGGCRYRW